MHWLTFNSWIREAYKRVLLGGSEYANVHSLTMALAHRYLNDCHLYLVFYNRYLIDCLPYDVICLRTLPDMRNLGESVAVSSFQR
jgi:hypothetical protein